MANSLQKSIHNIQAKLVVYVEISKKNLMFKDRVYLCEKCGNTLHRDINAANNILKRGLKPFGLGISLEDYKLKAFRVS